MRISDWSSDVCSSDLEQGGTAGDQIADRLGLAQTRRDLHRTGQLDHLGVHRLIAQPAPQQLGVTGSDTLAGQVARPVPHPLLRHRYRQAAAAKAELADWLVRRDRKSTRLNSSH